MSPLLIKFTLAEAHKIMCTQQLILYTWDRNTQKFNYVFYTLDLPDLCDEWGSLFRDEDEKFSMHCLILASLVKDKSETIWGDPQ